VDADPFLRRLERTAVIVCLAMAMLAFVISRGRIEPAIGVLGGGLLIWVSYRTIGSGVTALTSENGAPRTSWIVLKVVARYALLAFLAYVMIARLRLHPVGLLVGASSVAAAASIEALRLLVKKS
jgi:hypothetical protein